MVVERQYKQFSKQNRLLEVEAKVGEKKENGARTDKQKWKWYNQFSRISETCGAREMITAERISMR